MKSNHSKKDSFTYQRKIVDIDTSLGTLSLRYISLKDSDILIKYYEEGLNSEIYTKNFIINQNINQNISIEKLNELDKPEIIKIIKEYITKEDLNEYFDLTSIKSFDDFKEELHSHLKYYYEPHKSILKLVDKNMDKTSQLFEQINAIVPNLPNYHYNEISKASASARYAIDTLHIFNKYLPTIDLKGLQYTASNLIDTLQPLIDDWSNLITANLNLKYLQDKINTTVESLDEHFKKPMLEAMECLNRYSWFIPLNMDYSSIFEVLSICESDSKHKQSEINKYFINYYLNNNCKELTDLINIWEDNPLFKRRSKIFRDCVNTIKNSNSSTNFSNLVVPTLIAQIDGIQREFMERNNLEINRGKVKFLNGPKYKDGKVSWEDYYRELTDGDEILDAMNDIFLNVLFQHTMPGEDYKTSIHFSRHKILHGENIRYGRKDYTIRCFIILDFLYELSLKN